jgi:predicted glycoside hydrolase/deacetylase ChbG (UPF0249 family)
VGSVLVIVNADDLGISEQVNDAIFELMAEGRISSATLMANGPAVRHAAIQLKHFPRCSFGAHLNLTQFEPMSRSVTSRLLVDGTGQMTRANEQSAPSRACLKAMYEEMRAQVEGLAALGVPISHFDSHNHIHTRPLVLPALKALQKHYGMRKVRISKNLYAADQPCSTGLRWKKGAYNWALRHVYRTTTTDAFTEFLTFCDTAGRTRSHYKSVELMVHPGASYAARETEVLRSSWLAEGGLQLIDYGRLPR